MSGVSSSVSGELDMDAYELRVLREYYSDHAFFLSTEWFLKVLAVMGSIALSGLFLGGGSCAGAALAAGGAGVALAAAAAQALLCAAQAFQLPARAPRAWLFAQ
ncbi:uncharacterized protein LOC114361745 [Ostrinia furnacalis]|uniref:uncharacterized protein LOC114361745 n=1 Tax=Ostrinia furnacalis TaxID=93504 RepID=UPI0010400E96|nr:uncharacterized protein LOC114361745 [Ostrinia furnacalis]